MMRESELQTITQSFKNEAIVPFWMWNDRLERDKLIGQLREIKSKGINQVIIHPRFGLETPYLSEEWFEAVGWILNEAEQEKMGIWIYDELNWPSGYAGGKVLAANPDFQAQHLVRTQNGFEVKNTTWRPAYSSSGYYIDILNPKAVGVFLQSTYEQYWLRFKRYFGKTILGFFTDEPGFYNNFAGSDPNSLPWSEELPSFFKKRNDYPLEDVLDMVWEGNNPQSTEARIDFWQSVSQLYQESYFRQIQRWCHRHGVALLGHVLVEENLVDTVKTQGNFFSAMQYLDFAGYDLLVRLEPRTIIAANLAKAAASLFNLEGVCAETFGIFGRGLSIQEMKRVSQWQVDHGLDVLIPHALYYSLRGERYNDCPPSFFEDKYWNYFQDFVQYVRALKHNRKKSRTAIFYPIETVWAKLTPEDSQEAERVNLAFQLATLGCQNLQFDFDYVTSESILKNNGLNQYKYLILPETGVLPLEILKELFSFKNKGGQIISVGSSPATATRVADQESFEILLKEQEDLFQSMQLPENFNSTQRIQKLIESLKYFISRHFHPIWLARAVRIAKIFGYKKTGGLREETGLEGSLRRLIRI